MPAANSPSPNLLNWAVKTAVFCVFLAGQSAVINFSQFLGLILWPFSKFYYQSYIDHTKQSFGILLVAINQFFAPCNFVITTDESAKGIVKHTWNGAKAELDIPEKIILISNHQIYADWLYIWSFAYFANRHDAIKIILKESLKWLPIFGWGMQFFRFIFLHRKWAKDQEAMEKSLAEIASSNDPVWLLIFPEGTLVSESTRRVSKNFTEKNNLVNPRFMLFPRSTGLFVCTSKLQKSVEYIYDLTVGFEGVRKGEYPEDIYTLRKIYFEGKYPSNIHIHVRKFRIADLPSDEIKFTEWLRARWYEKDALMDEFYTNGRFLSVHDHPKVVPVQMNSVFELAKIWYFIIPLAPLVWYLLNV